jgi:NDP-sugar pyrophosphorylase family protein
MSRAGGSCLADIDIIVLAGGLGTRLRSVVADRPKILAPVGGRTILDWQLDWLACFGPKRIVLSLGYLAGQVEAHLRSRAASGIEIVTVTETEPLGTGGAVRFAAGACASDPVLMLNGDTLIEADLCAFLAFHAAYGLKASVLCAEVADARRFGRVEIAEGRITAFREKDPDYPGKAHVNAGGYLLARSLINSLPRSVAASIENDLLQPMAGRGLGAYSENVSFLDIGTPESFFEVNSALAAGRFKV